MSPAPRPRIAAPQIAFGPLKKDNTSAQAAMTKTTSHSMVTSLFDTPQTEDRAGCADVRIAM